MIDFTFSLLHSRVPPTGWLHSNWSPEPMVVLSAFALVAFYILWTGPINRSRPGSENRPISTRQTVAFLTGCLAYLIVLSPPLDDWADFYLLTAHMFQHMVIILVVAPLILVGLPGWMLQPLANNRFTNKIGWTLTRPLVAGVLSTAIVIIWHLPVSYDAALNHEPIHIAQHGFFLLAGLLAWWPVLGSLPAWPRIESPPLRCVYLFLYSFPNGVVGAFITLAAPGVYPFYHNVERIFGIGIGSDQQLAGLMMWVGGSLYYLIWITAIFLTWAGKEEAAERAPRPAAPSGPSPRAEAI